MGRKKDAEPSEAGTIEERFNWPWELSVDIGDLEPPKIAFLSGQERQFFPENPGHSRLGIEYAMNCAPGDVPNPSYYPPEDKLLKPVSRKGYGIGGLLGLRFPREPTNKIIKIPRRRTLDGPIEIKPIRLKPRDDPVIQAKKAAEAEKREMLKKLCSPLAFGSMKDVPRFGKGPKWSSVGPGHYNFSLPNLCKKPHTQTFFGTGPSTLLSSTVTECTDEDPPTCCECEVNLGTRDYYKSTHPIALPKIRFFLPEADKHPPLPRKLDETHLHRPAVVVICRKCFCRVMREGHTFWTKYDLSTKFQKTRHCINIHEHNNFPNMIQKVPCRLVRHLNRKEALMAKYFDDSCPKVIKEIIPSYSKAHKKPAWGKPVPIQKKPKWSKPIPKYSIRHY